MCVCSSIVSRTSHDEAGVWDVYEQTLESEDVCLFLVVKRRARPLHYTWTVYCLQTAAPCESVSSGLQLLFRPNTFLLLQSYYEGWNFNFGNTPLDWIQELLE